MYNILLIQRLAAPYRIEFYDQLRRSKILDITFSFGESSADKSLSTPRNFSFSGWKYIKLNNLYWFNTEFLCWQSKLLTTLFTRKYDVIIAEFNPRIVSNVCAYILSVLRKTPFIWWGHGLPRTMNENKINILIRKILIKGAKAVILYDENTKNRLIELKIPEKKLFVAHNAIGTSRIETLRKSHEKGKRFRIVFMGRFTKRKKVNLLIRAFSMSLPNFNNEVKLTLIGTGPEREYLFSLVKNLKTGIFVEFTGEIYEEEIIARYLSETLFSVAPGHIGLMAIHSLAYGLPVIVSKDEPHSPEVEALEHYRNAIFFESDSENELANAMVDLANDYQQREVMSANCLNTIRTKYCTEGMVTTFEQTIRNSTK